MNRRTLLRLLGLGTIGTTSTPELPIRPNAVPVAIGQQSTSLAESAAFALVKADMERAMEAYRRQMAEEIYLGGRE